MCAVCLAAVPADQGVNELTVCAVCLAAVAADQGAGSAGSAGGE